MAIPWKKDSELLAEVKKLEGGVLFENEVIFMYGLQLGQILHEPEIKPLRLIFRSPNQFPDAVLFRVDTNDVINIEFETESKNFEEHRHEVKKCDLIVCGFHNKDWENPIPVYELKSKKIYKPKKKV